MSERIHRTTIDLDIDVLDRARELLGTTTIRDTVDKALREANARGHEASFVRESAVAA